MAQRTIGPWLLVGSLAWAGSVALAFWLGQGQGPSAPESGSPATTPAPATASAGSSSARRTTAEPSQRVAGDILDGLANSGLAEGTPAMRSRAALLRLRQALRDTNPVTRAAAFAEALAGLDASNVDEFRTLVEAMPPGMARMREMSLFLYAWAAFDGAAATAYAEAEYGDQRGPGRFVVGSALAGWASRDPVAALEWAQTQGGGAGEGEGGLNPYLFGVLTGWANTDPDAATRYLATLPPGRERDRYTAAVANAVLQGGVDQAMLWANTLSDPSQKGVALNTIAAQLAFQRPEEAARFVQQYAAQDFARQAAGSVAAQWARQDAPASAQWAQALPDGEARARALANVAGTWGRQNPNAAAEWLNGLPADTRTDAAVASFAQSIVRTDPAGAIDWANTIADPAARSEALVGVGQEWMRRDEAAATAWINNSPLTPEQRQQALSPPRRRGGPR